MVNQLGELTASENETLNLINSNAGNLSQSAANSTVSSRTKIQTLANNNTSLSNAKKYLQYKCSPSDGVVD